MITMSTRKKIRKVQPQAHRPPLHLPRCPVEGKLCFPSPEAAANEIFECRMQFLFQNKRRRKETRSYLCDHCEAYHLTAMIDPPKHVSEGSRDGVQMTQQRPNPVRQPIRPAVRPTSGSGSGSAGWTGFTSEGTNTGSDGNSTPPCAPDAPTGGGCD